MKKIIVFIIGYLILNTCSVYSQSLGVGPFQPPINFPSPNAASLGVFGSTPVSPFTGTPNISIPLYTIKCGGLEVPISLSYHSGNLKVDAHPGWVGLGWVLNNGGQIVRKVNGLMDEWQGYMQKGYMESYSDLNRSDWNSTQTLYDYAFKSYYFDNTNYRYDLMADEFNFNFLNYSGKFYFDQTGHWKVISDQFIKIIDVEYNTFQDLRDNIWITNKGDYNNRFILKFTLLAPDGTKFIFGGEFATEYSVPFRSQASAMPCPTTWNLTKIITPNGQEITYDYESSDNPNGDLVNGEILKTYVNCSLEDYFNYEETYSIGDSPENRSFLQPACPIGVNYSATFDAKANGFLIFPVYLKRITFPNGKLEFDRSKSLEKRYLWTDMQIIDPFVNQLYYLYCPQSSNNDYCSELSWYQLNAIKLERPDNSVVKLFEFGYGNAETERLKLSTITESTFNSDNIKVSKYPYLFFYNEHKLPEYCMGNEDHWGFNNGRNNKGNVNNYQPNAYYTSREPDISGEDTQFEILQEVVYPTGGYTTYEYEPNKYNKVIGKNRELRDTTEKAGCGLRIKRIKDYSSTNKLASAREYYYVRNYIFNQPLSNFESSGILSGQIQYIFKNTRTTDQLNRHFDQYVFSSSPKFPLGESAQGSNIGYSEVVELIRDANNNCAGYKKYKFTNFDQDIWGISHPDQLGVSSNDQFTIYSPFYSRALERGKLLSIENYKPDNNPVQIIQNKYNASGNDFVRLIKTSYDFLCGDLQGSMGFVGTGYGEFAYRYDNTWTKTIDYDNNGNQTVADEKFLQYDPSTGLVKEEKSYNSDEKEITTDIIYPSDVIMAYSPGDAEGSAVLDLVNKNMINSPLQVIKKVNGNIVSADYNKYLTQNNLTLPKLSYKIETTTPLSSLDVPLIPYISNTGAYIKSSSFTPLNEQVYFDHDNHGNLVQYRKKNDLSTSYVWGYNNSVPTAMALNATSNEIAYCSFDASGDTGNWNLTGATVTYVPNSSVNIPARGVGYLSWLSGVISLNNLDPAKKYKLRFYAKTAGAVGISITGNGTVPITSDNKWNFYEYTFQGSSTVSLSCSAAVLVDELSVCPDNARMTTYTYDPLFGIKSSTDENNVSIYYEYDSFGRLSTIRDQDGNIVKQIDYNYRKPLTDKVQ